MSLHLVTGYAGSAHITSADQGAFNASVVGTGEYVMCTGNELSAQVISNNQIRILDGDVMMQGRHICLKKDTYEDVAIANGLQGLNRNDLIVLRYTKDANTGIESIALAVLQGVSTEGTASDPAYTTGDILSGECLLAEMPLYRVPLTGLNVGTLVPLFSMVNTMANHNHDRRYYTEAEVDAKIKAINDDLTASDGTAFQFAYNAETGEYGYMAKVAGADTFCPFSNAKKLYEALQYSGLVTEDMTFAEMCAVLAEKYPELLYIYKQGDSCDDVTGGWASYFQTYGGVVGSATFGVSYVTLEAKGKYNATVAPVIITTKKKISRRNKMYVEVSRNTGGVAYACYTDSLITSNETYATNWKKTNIATLKVGINEIDISALPDECYFCIFFEGSQASDNLTSYYLDVSNTWFSN